ncbi:ABC transporter ATP-binding protein, partial [Bacillus cereus]
MSPINTIIKTTNLTKVYGTQKSVDNLNINVQQGEIYGFIGRNGAGKTTTIRMLLGLIKPTSGTIEIFGEDLFQNQKDILSRIGSIVEVPGFYENLTAKENLLINAKIIGVYKKNAIEDTLEIVGLQHETKKLVGKYSLGMKQRLGIARALLHYPQLLILDEPTNHLDLFAVEWLEQFLKEYNGTVMVISHDRYFLDEVVTKIFDLEDGEIHVYHTNYSQFVEEKEERLLQEFQAYQEQQKKIKKMKEAIKRLREWANQANPPNEGLHKRARSMERALERMQKLKKPILERKQMGLQFEGQDRSGKDVVVIKEVSKGFADHPLFNEVNLHVRFQERAAIVGRNGTGKTTLLKLLLEQIEPDAGEIRIGSSVKIGYLSQHAYGNRKSNVLVAFREYVAVTEGEARHILAKFLFYGPAVFKKVTQLSGGEKMRLRLAQLMYQDINFLILDEPTNHLDIESREVLEEALEQYNGTILAVSHDRYFLNKLFEKTYWIDERKLFEFAGNYAWARQKWEERLETQV